MIAENPRCPLCESTLTRVRYRAAGDIHMEDENLFLCTTTNRVRPEILSCGICQHVFSNPKDWPADLGSEYGDLEDHLYLGMIPVKRRTFARAADVLEDYVEAPARILEIGSYAGLFLDECDARGFECLGIEPSSWGTRISRERGHDVRTGIAEEVLAHDDLGLFDAVVSWDVLEHVRDPKHFLSVASSRVRSHGFLIFSTLDRTNWFARATGKRWPWLIPMHLHYFDQRTVIEATRSLGFDFVSTMPHVHYTSAHYAMTRALGRSAKVPGNARPTFFERLAFPVGFGDVRTYVFQKTA